MKELTVTEIEEEDAPGEEEDASGEEKLLLPKNHDLPFFRRVAFGTANFTNLLAVSMWFPYSIAFYQKVLLLPAASAGTVILAGQVGGALSTPLLGDWSDHCRCRVPGRRKVFQLLGMACVVCSFFFMWHECLGCSSAPAAFKVVYYSSFAIVFQFGWAATQLGQISLIPELAPKKALQVELNSIRYGFSIAGNLIVFVCFWVLLVKVNDSVDARDLSPHDSTIFWVMALVVIVLGVPVSLIFQCFVHEKSGQNMRSLSWHEWIKNPRFYLVVCGYASARLMIILPQSYIPLYFIDTLNMDRTSIAKGPLILYIAGFLANIIIKRLNKYIGIKMLFFCGIAISWSSFMWFWVAPQALESSKSFLWPRDSIYGAIVLLGAGGAITNVLSMVLVAYQIGPYSGSSSFVYGWVVFADRLTNGIVVKVIQQFQPLQSNLLPEYYRHVIVFAPFAGSIWSLMVISLFGLVELYERRKRQLSIQYSS